jgi:hypothetical protein
MRRRIFNVFAAGSALLCLAITALWIRSYHVSEGVWLARHLHSFSAFSNWGRVTINVSHDDPFPDQPWTYSRAQASDRFPTIGYRMAKRDWRFWGFEWCQIRERSDQIRRGALGYVPGWWLGVPHAFLSALTSIAPLVWIWRHRPRRHRPAGTCPACGYDLRATPDRCPECGAIPKGAASV